MIPLGTVDVAAELHRSSGIDTQKTFLQHEAGRRCLREFLGNVTEGKGPSRLLQLYSRNAVRDSQHGSRDLPGSTFPYLWEIGKSPSSEVSQTCGLRGSSFHII